MMNSDKKINWLGIVLAVGMMISIAVSGVSLGLVYHMYKEGVRTVAEEETTKEDDVTIADTYVIKSTTQISDAYLSGDDSELSDTDKETLKMASDILDEITTDDMTLYEKEKAVYSWIATNISTDSGSMTVIPTAGSNTDNPHGVLKYKKAVCVGYATTFRLFMQMLDIPCKVEHNTECYHSWDVVQLDDDWYIVDLYYDSGKNNFEHFNITDGQQVNNGQSWDTTYFPAATGTKYSPIIMNKKQIKDIYAIPAQIRKAIKKNKGMVSVSFENAPSEHEQSLASDIVSTIQMTLSYISGYENMYFESSWMDDNGDPVLAVYICTTEEEITDYDVSDEESKAMQKAILKAFKDLGVTEENLVSDYEEITDEIYDDSEEITGEAQEINGETEELITDAG